MTPEQKAALHSFKKRTNKLSLAEKIYENLVGVGEADTAGEKLGQYIRGGTAAVARGMADVPALPANLAQLATMGVEKALGMEKPSMVSRALESLPDTREMLASVPVIGEESRYVAPDRAGEIISTMGEFAGGAGLTGGAGSMLRYGVAPALASETAGEVTKGTSAEPYARIGAALVAPSIAGKIRSPLGGADPALIEAAKRARDMGLPVSAGQETGSRFVQALEDTLQATPEQIDALTKLAMKTTGSNAKLALADDLVAVEKKLGNTYNKVLDGVESIPNQTFAQRADDVLEQYMQDAPTAVVTPRVKNVAFEIMDVATSPTPKPISLETFRKWRTSLGKLVGSNDEATRVAARQLRDIINDLTDEALIAAGRTKDLQKLREVRKQWWNFLGIKDAQKRGGQDARLGRITPEALRASVKRTQGDEAISMGRGTNLADLAVTSEAAIPSVSAVSAGGERTFSPELQSSLLGALSGGPLGMVAGMAGTSGVKELIQKKWVQDYLRNQAAGPTTMQGLAGTSTGLINYLGGTNQ